MRWPKIVLVLGMLLGLTPGLGGSGLGVFAQTSEAGPSLTRDEAEAAIRGRLGGQRAGFEDVFGGPGTELSGSGTIYDVPGYGLVMVSFLVPTAVPAPTDIAAVIVLRSERPENLPASEPDASDWRLEEAEERARSLLPTDVELGEARPSEEGDRVTAACTSEALATVFAGEDDAGQCQVTYLLTAEDRVSFITLALGSEAGATDAPVSCDGMVNWSQLAASSMTEAQELVGRVAGLNEDDPNTVTALREIARAFTRLAVAQALAPVPEAAAEANEAMVATFEAYGTAFSQAADAIEADDPAALEEAIATVEEASTSYVAADELILEALEACRLVDDTAERDTA